MPAAKRSKLTAPKLPSTRSASSPVARRKQAEPSSDYASESDASSHEPSLKRRKTSASNPRGTRSVKNVGIYRDLFAKDAQVPSIEACVPPTRNHAPAYHRPLLLDTTNGRDGRTSLLTWFDSVSSTRSMPWRKDWVDPATIADADDLRKTLERRAYEVWISEIMLQQTRVAVVIDYWNRWMDKWPTIQDLAAADGDDVLAAWRGLGYYSRAARIHEAAKFVVDDEECRGLLPASAAKLSSKIAGVGPYTAGAISSIVFGRAEPMVDGNVLRVLSRQLGIHGNIKTDKAVIDTIWAAADALAKAVGSDGDDSVDREGQRVSDRPGRWGQALMELGSTVCTPKPNCSECPITSTCRVYAEGLHLSKKKNKDAIVDVEDACTLCEPLDMDEEEDEAEPAAAQKKKPARVSTLEAFGFKGKPSAARSTPAPAPAPDSDKIANYARRFPLKVVKKPVRKEETLVCAIRRADGEYLIHRRPEKGLLAGLWELPSHTLDNPEDTTAKSRVELAASYVNGIFAATRGTKSNVPVRHVKDLGAVPWLFSHLQLTMHVHLFVLEGPDELRVGEHARWSGDVEAESMGTGMRKCWALVKATEE